MTNYLKLLTVAFVALFAFQMTAIAQVPTEDQERPITQEEGDVVSVIEQQEELSLFAEALRESGIAEELTAEGPFTVFAPNDEAFEEKLNGMKEEREQPPYDAQQQDQEQDQQDRPMEQERQQDMFQDMDREELAQLVRAHIVMGEVRAADLQPGTELQTLEGSMLTVRESEDTGMQQDPYDQQQEHEPQERQERQEQEHAFADLQIENSRLLQTDVEAGNGVVHIIDQVLEVAETTEPVTGEEN